MADLRECPFCGGEAEIWEDKVFCTYVPQCKECNAQRVRYINKENAIKSWNTRKPMEDAVEKLEKASYRTESTFDEDGYCNDDSEEVVELHTAISIVRGKE